MKITSAQYIKDLEDKNVIVKTTIDDKEMFVPMDIQNIHYKEILKQVEEKKLIIKDAE